MLRRDFLKRMAFAAIASGVMGRLPLRAEPVEWSDAVDITSDRWATVQYPVENGRTLVVTMKGDAVAGLNVGDVVTYDTSGIYGIPHGPGRVVGIHAAARGRRSLAEMRALARS